MPPRAPLPHIERTRAKGRTYYYVRIKGKRVCRLPGEYGSPEFLEAYAATLRMLRNDPKSKRHGEGTVGWLIAQYRGSQDFRGLAEQTRGGYARHLDALESIATFPAVEIKRKHIRAIRDQMADTPRKRQLFGQVCSLLFNFGIRELELEMANPAAKLRRDGEAKSWDSWTDEQMAAFEASSPPRHLMTAYMIARYAGPRRSDVVRMTRQHYDGLALQIAGTKTDTPLSVPVHPRLKAYLDSLPLSSLMLIVDEAGKAISPSQLSKGLRAHLDAIGLPSTLVLHGLRHTAGKALAEAGCSPHEIAAVLGHKTLQMVERYTKTARQKVLARAAITKLGTEQK